MCGITGILTTQPGLRDRLESIAHGMNDCIVHRGPDDHGVWSDPAAGVSLGFRRLAIIDLTSAGHQPMQSASRRFTIVFNGEVYNYVELRAELKKCGAVFRSHSDTEVILAAFERWGIESAVKRFIGMFAIAVWDAERRSLSLIRDPLGKKPLYYALRSGLLTFASELKALVAGPQFDRTIDESALSAYLRYLYVPAPLTIFKSVRKLQPGSVLTIADVTQSPLPVPYWSIESAYRAGQATPFDGSDEEAVAGLRELLSDAVRLRMRSDVPMGALLSGGVDSSTVVALMQANASQPTRTFSISFPGTPHDEAHHAARIADVLGTRHTEMAVTGSDALAVVPKLPDLFDEPLADPSQVPTYLVCKLARQSVTVALTGDGGDEIFGGYERYIQGERLIARLQRVPRFIRQVAGAGIRSSSSRFWDRAYRGVAPLVDRSRRHRLAGQKIGKLGELLPHRTASAMYHSLVSAAWQNPADAMRDFPTGSTRVAESLAQWSDVPLFDRMMLVDQATYLPDDLLAKVDRASMAVSLEARVPILDRRVLEFSWRLRRDHKVRNGVGKWILRRVVDGYVPAALLDRPKTGFTVPIAEWLRGPLRSWADDLIAHDTARTDDLLSQEHVGNAWTELKSGRDERALAVWSVVMYRAWRQRWLA
jgi:asparagine synthase (glutamine-hydrolysing)